MKMSAEEISEILKLYNEGMSLRKTLELLGYDKSQVNYMYGVMKKLRDEGVYVRVGKANTVKELSKKIKDIKK